jgi:predicted TIM-barrel fold metal-dependent hydrolase
MSRVIDFRSRPNTEPFMGIYSSPDRDPWKKFRTVRPPTETLPQYVKNLAAAGVNVGVFTGRQGVLAGNHAIPNEYIASCVEAYPDSIRGFGGIDPRETGTAVAEIDRCVRELRLSGIALDPPSALTGDGPTWDDERLLFPLYERASDLGVAVVLTMGPVVGRHGAPSAVDRVAVAFPNLQIICSHGVWPQTMELIALAFRRSNVILETSIYIDYPGAAALIVDAANTIIQEQIVYASAYPFTPLEGIDRFRTLGFAKDALAAVCYGNAARILKLGT